MASGYRKFVVVMTALLSGSVIAFLCKAEVLSAYGSLAAICVGAYMAAHGIADSKWGAK